MDWTRMDVLTVAIWIETKGQREGGWEEVLGRRVVKWWWWWAEVRWMVNGQELAYLAFAWQCAAA